MLGKLLQAFRNTRRRAARVERSQQAHLFAGVRPLGPVRLADLSGTGVRVDLVRPFSTEGASRLLVLESSQLFDVEPVWTRGSQAGFRITGSFTLRGYAEGEAEQIKDWWIANRLGGPE